jgi:hypothetical protein
MSALGQKQTCAVHEAMSAKCQWRTSDRYSITSSARSRNDPGIVRQSALAVVRFTTSSNFVGCSTGISSGFVPRKTNPL